MIQAIQYASWRMGHVILGALVVAGAYFATTTIGPMFDGSLAPVVRDFRVIAATREGNVVTFRVAFNKVRACEYLGTAWFVGDPAGEFERVQIEFLDQQTGAPRTRPVGRQRAGWWRVTIPVDFPASQMFGVTYHDCGMPWQTQTMEGPVEIPIQR